jgi:hypothetical protein
MLRLQISEFSSPIPDLGVDPVPEEEYSIACAKIKDRPHLLGPDTIEKCRKTIKRE